MTGCQTPFQQMQPTVAQLIDEINDVKKINEELKKYIKLHLHNNKNAEEIEEIKHRLVNIDSFVLGLGKRVSKIENWIDAMITSQRQNCVYLRCNTIW